MKKIYNKPNMKCVKLLSAESLLTGSGKDTLSINGDKMEGDTFLSNQESEHDIWGDDGSSMWK